MLEIRSEVKSGVKPEVRIDKIIRSKRRTIALEIGRDASLLVRAPYRTPLAFIEKIVMEKHCWIKGKQAFIREKGNALVPKKFVTGEEFLYLGNMYRLEFIDRLDNTLIFNNGFQISRENIYPAKELLTAWYKEEACRRISERVSFYSSMSGLLCTKIRISEAQKRWGSCSSKGNLNFSWRLIMAPLKVIDYVVVHELAHLEQKNHAKGFWDKVKTIMPDYNQHRKWLKENGPLLNV